MQFTVAITVYKTEQFLPRAVQTVMAQTVSDWEIRMYSDGRSSRSEEMFRRLEGRIPIHYRRIRRRRGLYGNHLRRLALEEGKGAYVCYLGHDNLLYPTYLEEHARNIAGREDVVSMVPIAYWKNCEPRSSQPIGSDPMTLGEGEMDLMCVAYPRRLSLELDCFGSDMQQIRCADFLAYDRLRKKSSPIFRPIAAQGAHF